MKLPHATVTGTWQGTSGSEVLPSVCNSYIEVLRENLTSCCPKYLTKYVDARSHRSELMFCSRTDTVPE